MSNSTETGSPTLDYFANMAKDIAVNFTPLLWFEQMSKLFCFICNSEDPKVRAASGALNLAIVAFVVAVAAKVALSFWTFYKYYIQQQYISAGANAYETKYKGLWVVITGATDGIGLAFAKKFAEKKAKIVIVSRTQSKLDAVKEELEKLGADKVDTVQCDFAEISHGKNIDSDKNFNSLKSQLDLDNRKVGILVNNVGIMPEKSTRFHNQPLDSLLSVMDVNFKSAVIMSWLVAPHMAKRKVGLIVNVSSLAVFLKSNYIGSYRVSKLAMDGLGQQLAFEYPDLALLTLHTGGVKTKIFTLPTGSNSKLLESSRLEPDVYAKSAMNIIQAAATSPGLTVTTGHMLFELLEWITCAVEFVGIGAMLNKFMNLDPQEDTAQQPNNATQTNTTANKDVAETNIDIPLSG